MVLVSLHPVSYIIGYRSVSYLRLVNGRNEAHCSFLCTNSCVAPLKMKTIPRLELSAAVTAVKQERLLKRELEIPVNARSVFWTGSTSILRYAKNETNRYNTLVANRVSIIRHGSKPNQWFHVKWRLQPCWLRLAWFDGRHLPSWKSLVNGAGIPLEVCLGLRKTSYLARLQMVILKWKEKFERVCLLWSPLEVHYWSTLAYDPHGLSWWKSLPGFFDAEIIS